MAFFTRNKNQGKHPENDEGKGKNPDKGEKAESYRFEKSNAKDEQARRPADRKPRRDDSQETSPQRVGIVSGVLSTPADSDDLSQFGAVVERRFGPGSARDSTVVAKLVTRRVKISRDEITRAQGNRSSGRVVEPPLDIELDVDADDETQESPKLEVDPMALIGQATTITGNIVAEEDLEIQGTIDGSVRLAKHRVVVGSDGIVNAIVEAHAVLVIGKISGNVIATELVEVNAGGVIEGDVKAPRIIMHDGAIVIGSLDMSAASSSGVGMSASAPGSAADPDPAPSPTPVPDSVPESASNSESLPPVRPRLMKVEVSDDPLSEKDSI
jgi:cytoskeletal protein CcmA (bactofilin family)